MLGRVDVRTLNGLPAVVIEFSDRPHHQAPRLVMRCEIGRDGRITALHTILATRKLTAVGS